MRSHPFAACRNRPSQYSPCPSTKQRTASWGYQERKGRLHKTAAHLGSADRDLARGPSSRAGGRHPVALVKLIIEGTVLARRGPTRTSAGSPTLCWDRPRAPGADVPGFASLALSLDP